MDMWVWCGWVVVWWCMVRLYVGCGIMWLVVRVVVRVSFDETFLCCVICVVLFFCGVLFSFFLSSNSRQDGAQGFDEAARCRRGWVHTPSSTQHSELGHCVVGTGADRALLVQQSLPLEY